MNRGSYRGAASYANGAASLAAGFFHIDNGNVTQPKQGASPSDSCFSSSVNNAYASARSINIARVGGNNALGSVMPGGNYSFSEYNRGRGFDVHAHGSSPAY